MKLTWYGHSAFRIETQEARILIDPFFTGNPGFKKAMRKGAVEGLTHIALTHGHDDHVGDTVAIARDTGATVIANADLASWLGFRGAQPLRGGNLRLPQTSCAGSSRRGRRRSSESLKSQVLWSSIPNRGPTVGRCLAAAQRTRQHQTPGRAACVMAR